MLLHILVTPLLADIFVFADYREDQFKRLKQIQGTGGNLKPHVKVNHMVECSHHCSSERCKCFSLRRNESGDLQCALSNKPNHLESGSWKAYIKRWKEKILMVKRTDNSVNFYRNWATYRAGFGDPNTNYWIGLNRLHQLTKDGNYGLKVEMTGWDGKELWSFYETFIVGPESDKFRLSVSGFNDACSPAGDSLINPSKTTWIHNSMQFSTHDNDNDMGNEYNCANVHNAGWWYNLCQSAQPTGQYDAGHMAHRVNWRSAPGYTDPYSFRNMTWYLIPK